MPADLATAHALMRSLLSVNFVYGLGGLAVFSIDDDNGHVILTLQRELATHVTAQDLLGELREANAQAVFAWETAMN